MFRDFGNRHQYYQQIVRGVSHPTCCVLFWLSAQSSMGHFLWAALEWKPSSRRAPAGSVFRPPDWPKPPPFSAVSFPESGPALSAARSATPLSPSRSERAALWPIRCSPAFMHADNCSAHQTPAFLLWQRRERWLYLSLSDGILQLCDLSQHRVLIGQDVVQLLGDLVLGFKNNTQDFFFLIWRLYWGG